VAIIGGGCAALTTAFELTRPELDGAYHVTIYQVGWRLGGKGASGRGPADRIEEHGLHVWLGFYENAFRLIRECYAELERDPAKCPIADWQDAFFPDPFVGIAEPGKRGRWRRLTALFPPAAGLPGDRYGPGDNPFTMQGYITRTVALLQMLLLGVDAQAASHEVRAGTAEPEPDGTGSVVDSLVRTTKQAIKYGVFGTVAALSEAAGQLDVLLRSLPRYSRNTVLDRLRDITRATRQTLDEVGRSDDETRHIWEIIDLVLAILTGIFRYRIVTDERGFDAINEYECREWLKDNGASDASLDSSFVRGLFDLAMAYPGGESERPALAAGQAVRGALRMFFTYRGALFWKMRAGMGDIVFAPLYEVLKKRGASFKFFHRLENVRLVDRGRLGPGERPYVESLEFDVQALIAPSEISGRSEEEPEYRPLIDIRGLPCWPAAPDYSQLVDGERLRAEQWEFESFWDRRRAAPKTLRVGEDFDFVVLGVGVGAIPHVCRELVETDERWRLMVEHVRSVPTQAFQIWLREGMSELGWKDPPVVLSAFVKPFDTWADMTHLVDSESWTTKPASIAYFCSVLPDSTPPPSRDDADYPRRRRAEVRANAIRFLERDVAHLWPRAVDADGFRWQLLVDPAAAGTAPDAGGPESFDSQFWTANVNPSDRYTLAPPGSLKFRISPLDNSYDNLTIAGDWTACGFTEGCVEAAVMSGLLAAHALSPQSAPLKDIIGYDHP
jgi:uncharacterized protein with NAD-binding domain and iron-sulfur cluster